MAIGVSLSTALYYCYLGVVRGVEVPSYSNESSDSQITLQNSLKRLHEFISDMVS